MKRFDELYEELLKATIDNWEEEYIENLDAFDAHQLDCLLTPKTSLVGLLKAVSVQG